MKTTKILLPTTLLIIVAVFFLFITKNETPNKVTPVTTETAKTEEKAVETITKTETTQPESRYVIHTPENFEQYNGKKRVLFFYASWCPTCQPVNNDLMNKSTQIPENYTVIRVNYNDSDTDSFEKELAEKYAVTYQHTFVVIDEEGNEITKWNGGDFENILDRIK